MKKLFLTIAAISALTFVSKAQNNSKTAESTEQTTMTPEQKADKETKTAVVKLGLDEAQQAKFKVYALDRARSNKALREKGKTATKEERLKYRAEAKTNNDKFHANVNTILTPDQQVKWAEHKKKMDEKHAKNQAHD